jgi:hypothetical protein
MTDHGTGDGDTQCGARIRPAGREELLPKGQPQTHPTQHILLRKVKGRRAGKTASSQMKEERVHRNQTTERIRLHTSNDRPSFFSRRPLIPPPDSSYCLHLLCISVSCRQKGQRSILFIKRHFPTQKQENGVHTCICCNQFISLWSKCRMGAVSSSCTSVSPPMYTCFCFSICFSCKYVCCVCLCVCRCVCVCV